MVDQIIVGPVNRGLRTDREPFVIDDDSFPTLINAYQWRGRIRRKRGTSLLNRLTRYFDSTVSSYGSIATIAISATGRANLLSGFGLEDGASILPGSISITDTTTGEVYTDPTLDGVLVGNMGGTGDINYASGAFNLSAGSFGHSVSAHFIYYPSLPVMGLEDLKEDISDFPRTMAFDTVYSYIIPNFFPYSPYDVSFYKNPDASPLLPGYVPKTFPTATRWNGQNYQQFWTINYQGALWATNGINVPFSVLNIGMQFAPASSITYTANTATTITLDIVNSPLVVGDFVFFNEWTGANAITLNFQTGYVTTASGGSPNTVIITLPDATLGAGPYTPGIVQYLTNMSDTTKDVIKWFDGDPTNGNPTTPVFTRGFGWVNFMPPLSVAPFSIADTPPQQYYLVGARVIQSFKDRLLFVGPVIQSSIGNPIYLADTVIYSQNGTPYYTASFTGDPTLSTTVFNELLVPDNQTATPNAYWEDQTGFGGFITAGIDNPILTCLSNEDVMIMGSTVNQMRFVYTGNDILPFTFYAIDSELTTSSTFSGINMGDSVISRGDRGFIASSQRETKRIDIDILDQNFEISLTNNGAERFTAQRDYLNEWIYFTYRDNEKTYIFPNQTLQYNYRDDSWAIFNESYTTYGQFRKQTGFIWSNVGDTYPTWSSWTAPWNAGSSTLFAPEVIAGNQQGFVILRDDGTNEANSLAINSIAFPSNITDIFTTNPVRINTLNSLAIGQQVTISGVLGTTELNGNTYTIVNATTNQISIDVDGTLFTPYVPISGKVTPVEQVYVPGHALDENDYIVISGAIGTIAPSVNGQIFSVQSPTENGFRLNPQVPVGTYRGKGLIKRMYVPYIQTKQFPVSWGIGRKTRIGAQKYLLSTTPMGQIQLLIFLSQNSAFAYNSRIPKNSSLIYSTVLYTCPESTNLGLTPANTNLQMIVNAVNSFAQQATIVGVNRGITTQIVTSPNNVFVAGTEVLIQNIVGTTELNDQSFTVISSNGFSFTIAVDSRKYTPYISGGTATPETGTTGQEQIWHRISTSLLGDTVQLGFTMSDEQMRDTNFSNQFVEIELHGFILDVYPSQLLA